MEKAGKTIERKNKLVDKYKLYYCLNSKWIALKEANETQYWLKLMFATEYLTEQHYSSIKKDIDEIIAILVAITKTTKEKLKSK